MNETQRDEMLQMQTRVEVQFHSTQVKYIKEQNLVLPPYVGP